MDHKTLKSMRLAAPALLWSLSAFPLRIYFPAIAELGKIDTPIVKGGAFVALATVIYLALGIRALSNYPYYRRVHRNLASKLWIYAHPGKSKPKTWDWSVAKHVFYPIVDGDESLKIKAQNVYSSGIIWTTIADVRAISILTWIILLLLAYFVGFKQAITPWLIALPIVALASFLLSEVATDTQMRLGDEQLEHIALHHGSRLTQLVDEALAA